MKIQTKLTALLLTLPLTMAYAEDLAGAVPTISTLGTPSISGSFFSAGAFDGADGITVQIDNNDSDGWEVTADSTNDSMFAHQASVTAGLDNTLNALTIDGLNLQYNIACDAVAEASSTSATSLGAYSSPLIISTVTSPTTATVAGSLVCDIAMASGETESELFEGSYEDIITLTLNTL
jgi:hypothetical protein